MLGARGRQFSLRGKVFRLGSTRLRWFASGAVVTLVAAVSPALGPAVAAAAVMKPPTPPQLASVRGVHPLRIHHPATAVYQAPNYVPSETAWPKAAATTLHLDSPPASDIAVGTRVASASATAPDAVVRAGAAPVWAQRQPGGPAAVSLSVHDQALSHRLGVDGVVISGTATAAGRVRVGLDYKSFAQVYGGNYGASLGLSLLPACALTTPTVATCQRQTPLASSNDVNAQTVSAVVGIPATVGNLTTSTAIRPGGGFVIVAAAVSGDGGGSAGTYGATTLKASGSWSEGGDTGSFNYTYPIPVPPAPTALTPKLDLTYDSGSVDGETAASQVQSSWLGDGWDMPHSYIEQTFVPCNSTPNGPEGTPTGQTVSDMCYDGKVMTMSLNGSSTSLVWDATAQVWKAQSDSGDVITEVAGGTGQNADKFGNYWKVIERDGTVYYFGLNKLPGWTSGKSVTDSVATEPVYSGHQPNGTTFTDPCWNATFTSSWCTMAYRWNLDYVVDVHHNAMAYFYQTSSNTNYYAQDGKTTVNGSAYIRDSYLDHILYGFVDPNFYTTTAPDEVVFNPGDRCVSGTCDPLNATNAANWPDVPFTDICAVNTHCSVTSPTFFSEVRLASIVTKQYNGTAYVAVDTWTLTQTLPSPNLGNPNDHTNATLWLSSIVHQGNDTSAGGTGSISLPAVSFGMVQKANRVDTTTDGLGPLDRWRISTITLENGSQITVSYTQPNACTAPVTTNPQTNTSSCYPVYWTPSGHPQLLDWFNKWVVSSVSQSDPFSDGVVTNYTYLGGAAWRYDDNEVVQQKYRTYGQYRGYAEVQTRTGNASVTTPTLADTTYYRGMDHQDSRNLTVNLTDSQGGTHLDANQLAGNVLESSTYTKDTSAGGVVDHSAITSYWVSAATATRDRSAVSLPNLTANIVQPVENWSRQAVTSSGTTTWRVLENDTAYNTSTGLMTEQYAHTVPATSALNTCTTTTYAPANTAANLVGLASEVEVDQLACGGFTEGAISSVPGSVNTLTAPAGVSRPADVMVDTRTFYDNPTMATTWPQPANPTWPQPAPTLGDISVIQQATDTVNGSPGYGYVTQAATVYDSYGRTTSQYDSVGHLTATAYSMTNGVVASMTVTNPLGQQATTTYDSFREIPTMVTDPNLIKTSVKYDALGRTTGVWTQSRDATRVAANAAYSYTMGTATTPTVVTTTRLNDASGTVVSTALYDGLLRTAETQTPTPIGGRDVTETFYDTHGWATQQDHAYYDSSTTPNGSMVTLANGSTPNYDVIGYDGMGRPTLDTSYNDGTAQYVTATADYGDRTTTYHSDLIGGPTNDATATTTIVDQAGRTIELDDYTTPPTVTTTSSGGLTTNTISGGASQAITYHYDRRNHRDTVTAGSPAQSWTTTSNLLGQVTSKVDPDAGTSTMTYDAAGNIATSSDADGHTLSYRYDALNRKTAEYDGPDSGSPMLASWTYDTPGVTDSIGHLVSSSEFVNGNEFKEAATGFNAFGESTGETYTIPGSAGTLAGQYAYSHFYMAITGLPSGTLYPASPALPTSALPSEAVSYSYTSPLDLPSGLTGTSVYAQSTSYDGLGRPTQETINNGTGTTSFLQYAYYPHDDRLQTQTLKNASNANIDAEGYTYDAIGNITRQTDTRNGTTTETQCYTYDHLDRLTQAWTATDNCAADPAGNNGATVGDPITGSAYWTGWQYNQLGDRLAQTDHSLTGGAPAITTSTFSPAQPDTLTATTTTVNGVTTGSASYSYDPVGNTLTRNVPGGNQALTWNDQDQLATDTTSAGTTSYVYDAAGNLILRQDPATTTLFLPGQQLVRDNTSNNVTGTRTLPLPNGGVVVRSGGTTNYNYELGDQHGSATITLDHTAQTPTWRQFTPYGAPRGTPPGSWPDQNGYLNQPSDTVTALTNLGAREYDPATGRFISPDPVFDATDPNQLGGYTYAGGNPTTLSDPSGTYTPSGGCIKIDGYVCGSELKTQAGRDTLNIEEAVGADHSPLPTYIPIGPLDLKINSNDSINSDNYKLRSRYQSIVDSRPDLYQTDYDKVGLIAQICEDMGANQCPNDEYDALMLLQSQLAEELCPITNGSTMDAYPEAGSLRVPPTFKNRNYDFDYDSTKISEFNEGQGGGSTSAIGRGCGDSFDPHTPVLMADGSTKPIAAVVVGDKVRSTDPTTGTTTAEPVTQLHDNLDTDLTDLTVTDHHGSAVIHATSNHPFWDVTTAAWTPAEGIKPGDKLSTVPGNQVVVRRVRTWIAEHDMRNLTVAQIHTYYVVAGGMPILVHNVCPVDDETGLQLAGAAAGEFDNPGGMSGVLFLDGRAKGVPLSTGSRNLRPTYVRPPGATSSNFHHLEAQAAAAMRYATSNNATLFINGNYQCGACLDRLTTMLPPGATLTVVFRDSSGQIQSVPFRGDPD